MDCSGPSHASIWADHAPSVFQQRSFHSGTTVFNDEWQTQNSGDSSSSVCCKRQRETEPSCSAASLFAASRIAVPHSLALQLQPVWRTARNQRKRRATAHNGKISPAASSPPAQCSDVTPVLPVCLLVNSLRWFYLDLLRRTGRRAAV